MFGELADIQKSMKMMIAIKSMYKNAMEITMTKLKKKKTIMINLHNMNV